MSLRKVEIAQALSNWLDRYSCPMHLREKPEAAQKEAEALAGVLTRFAPNEEFQPFLNRVFSQLDYQMKTRAWPTVSEMGAACSNVRKESRHGNSQGDTGLDVDMRPEAITARAMLAGKPVGEGWLYGRSAVDMIAAGLIDKDTMDRYRSGAFFARKDLYGEEKALEWEAEAKARHEDAKRIRRESPVSGRDTSMPDKRAVPGFAA
jgi:hypothetical protein